MDVASKLSNACTRNKKYATAVGAIMLQMLEICEGINTVDVDRMSEEIIIETIQASFETIHHLSNLLLISVIKISLKFSSLLSITISKYYVENIDSIS